MAIGRTCETINGHRGPSTIDLLGTGYTADIYHKGSYIAEKHELANKLEILIARADVWDPGAAHRMVQAALDHSDPQYSSWIGFRKSDAPRGEYEGASWQEDNFIPTPQGDKDVLWMKFRIFTPEAQGLHLGRLAMQLSLSSHPEAELIGHKTGSARAVRAWLLSGIFRPGGRFSRDRRFADVPGMANVLIWLWENYRIKGEVPNLLTGVSIGDYEEQNRTYTYNPNYRTTEEHEWMTNELGFNFERLDTLYEVGELA